MRFCFIILILLASCSAVTETTLEEEDFVTFGQQIEYAFDSDQLTFVKNRFSQAAIYNNTVRLMDSLELDTERFTTGESVKKKMIVDEFNEYIEFLQSRIGEKGDFRFIRPLIGKRNSLLFGIDYQDARDFIEFDVEVSGDKLVISDYYVYFTGIRYSEYFSWRELNRNFYGMNKGLFAEAWQLSGRAGIYYERGQTEKAWQTIQKIPEEFAYHPVFHTTREHIAMSMPDSVYEETLFEKIGIHWDYKKTRYMNLAYYYRIFHMPDTAMIYLDSLQGITGENFLLDSLRMEVDRTH